MINQESIARVRALTIADATALNMRVGEIVSIDETGVAYKCNATAGDLTLANGLFLRPVNHVLRGSDTYPEYQAGRSYAVGDKVYRTANQLYYRCIKAAGTGDSFSLEFFQELSLEGGFRIVDTATAFAAAHNGNFSNSIKVMGDLAGLTNGQVLTEVQANEIVKSLGVNAYFNVLDNRVLPAYSFNNNSYGVYGGNVDDPTNPSAMMEIIIPSEFLHAGQRLSFIKMESSASENKSTYVYQGAPSTGVQLDPIIGRAQGDAEAHISVYEITDSSVDLHILFQNELILDIKLENFVADLHTPNHLAASIEGLGLISEYTHGDTTSVWDAKVILSSLGNGA